MTKSEISRRAATMRWKKENKERELAGAKRRREENIEDAREYGRQYYHKTKDNNKINANHKKYRIENPWYQMYHTAKRKSNSKDIPFNITQDYIKEIWPLDNKCPVFGIEFTRTECRDTSASLDRIKPHLGYVVGNVCVISCRANRIKNDSTAEELQQVLNYVLSVT